MIKPISFAGKAYFLDNVLKTIPQDHKRRIERYAEKCEENTNVVVIGTKKDTVYEYDGVTYGNNNISYITNTRQYRLQTPKGSRTVPAEHVKISEVSVPVYNAYIIYDFNTENVRLAHYFKEFDFRPGAKSKLIGCNYREHDDIQF
jgi:hypothetical protein